MQQPKPIANDLRSLVEDRIAGGEFERLSIPKARSASRDPQWHVVQVMTGSERTVAERVKEARYGVYYPLLRVLKPVPKKKLSVKQRQSGTIIRKPALEVFLPGYMFIEFDERQDDWHHVFSFAGVRGMWCNGNQPKPFPSVKIEEWMDSEVDGAIPGTIRIEKLFQFKIGENVRINAGPFAGHNGVVEDLPKGYNGEDEIQILDESKRVTLLVSMFGRETKAHIQFGEFEKI